MRTPGFIVFIQKSICSLFVLLWILSALAALFLLGMESPVAAAASIGVFVLGSIKWSPFSASKRDLIAWFFLTLFTINPVIGGAYIPIPITWVCEVINSRPEERLARAVVGLLSGSFVLLLFLPSLRFVVEEKSSNQ